MLKISILKVESPSCLWGRVVWGPGGVAGTKDHYDTLQAQMNLFYHDVTQDLSRLKPALLEEGQAYVVYWAVKKSWCRAVMESVIIDSISCQALCLLVDYGERIVISSDQVRVALADFLQLPYWVRKFHLSRIKPTTLQVSVYDEKAELKPSSVWDSSTTLYLHKLLQASTQTEAVLLEVESDSTSIELYLTINNIKICVNDDLVAKKFAYYSRHPADSNCLDGRDWLPVMLSSNILTPIASKSSNRQTAQTKQLCCEHTVKSGISNPVDAGDWLTASSLPQGHLPDLVTCDRNGKSLVLNELMDSTNQSRKSLEAAETKSDSSEDTDSSLAAALTENLSLFWFQKFLNPDSSYQQTLSDVDQNHELNGSQSKEMIGSVQQFELSEWRDTSNSSETILIPSHNSDSVPLELQPKLTQSSSLSSEAEGDLYSSQCKHPADNQTNLNKSVELGQEAGGTWRTEDVWVCLRFLEWLNPEPINSDPDSADNVISPTEPRMSGILVHSAQLEEPCNNLEDAPITDVLRQVLKKKKYCTLSPADRYSWPAVARGYNTVIISHNTEQPLSYLAPLLSHIQLNSVFTSFTSSLGPIAVLLCPGWERAQMVYDMLEESKVSQTLHPVIILVGIGKNEAKAVKIPKNCLLLVTTPFTLVRLLSCHCFMFLRVYHLVLDKAEELFALVPDQMDTILQHFQKVTCSEETFCPKQLVVVAKRWTNHMETLIGSHMPSPYIIISVPEEAALYGNVQQVILMTLESNKIQVLLGALDFSPAVGQKSLIVTNSVQEVEDVFKAVSNKSAFCLKTHEGLTHQFDFVMEQWRKEIGPGTNVILVTTNDCLKCLGIKDATCLIHHGFPTSPKVFGSRLFCMAENFRNLCEGVCSLDQTESNSQVLRSVLLPSERNASHIVGVLRYLKRTNALLPPELLAFAQGVHAAREDQKMDRPLCSYLKRFGFCSKDSGVCPDRHQFHCQLDKSVLPASGVIEVVPLYIKSASVFFGRMVKKDDKCFDIMASEMVSYYADKKPGAKELLEGCLYAVQEDEVFHRVKILSIPEQDETLFFTVLVVFIDVGKEDEVKSHQIFQLPEQFQSLPGQAIEVIICRVKPADAEINWHPKVTRTISQKVRGLQHQARAVLSLGNTVFVDPMVRVTKVPGMKTFINEYNVQSEILNTGMAISNPDHLDLLRELCEKGLVHSTKDNGSTHRLEEDSLSADIWIKTEETFRTADDMQVFPLDPPLNLNGSKRNQSTVQIPPLSVCDQKSQLDIQTASRQRGTNTAELMQSVRDGGECCTSDASLHLLGKDLPEGCHHNTEGVSDSNEADIRNSTLSFHPQVVWHQTLDSVILTVKLINPENQRWDFYPDRVVYSGRVNSQDYRADLQLHQKIAADLCRLEMKSYEPVLKLVKQQQGYWERLATNKNMFVSYNMEHIDEDEDKALNDVCFVEDTGEHNWYVNSESGSESD
ncbi:putative ATP-dependent RNA helicase TDRD12 isoform X2 [Kryptolebias marmoratus]|nr:putative ATP-dependent RNA helicase TDRD12 isoform X2 [Kryptolebias marmoratus]